MIWIYISEGGIRCMMRMSSVGFYRLVGAQKRDESPNMQESTPFYCEYFQVHSYVVFLLSKSLRNNSDNSLVTFVCKNLALGSSTPSPCADTLLYKASLVLNLIVSCWGKYNNPDLGKKMALSSQTAPTRGGRAVQLPSHVLK